MPDQLPSAILDSANSFDTLFALNLDTKQRFDNILSGVQKPIDYPIPDYNKDMNPGGLPQDELLNPNRMAGSIGEGLFSTDPRIASYATDRFRSSQSRYPINQGIGQPDRFDYSKEMNKYLKGDYGYNPYMSLEDNEDFNYRYDYLNQNAFKRLFSNIGTGVTRFVGSVGLKLGQSLGHLGSMIWNGVEEIFDGKDNNFMADVSDNSLSRWFEGLEQDMKDSNLLSVFKPRGWEDKGFFAKLGNGAFWTDEVADGAAFMGEMVASMYLMGNLGRIGALGRLGSTEINLAKAFSKLGTAGRVTGRGLDSALKLATGADNLSGVGRWALATTSEAAFEASGLYKERKEKLQADREAGLNDYTDLDIEKIAGDSAAAAFKANMLILSASNAFENRFIFGPLFKKMGVDLAPGSARGSLIDVNKSINSLDDIAKASRRTYNYKTWLGKKVDWKNSNSRARFYGSRGLSAVAAEGFWEENAQLAAERLASADNLTLTSFASKMKDQTFAAIMGDDPEASTSIGLGALIGGGASTAIAKIRGGNQLFQGERRKIESDTLAAVETYEKYRKGFLNYQDIYVTDGTGLPLLDADGKPQLDENGKPRTDGTGKPIMDSEGNLQIDPVKAAGLFDGTNKFLSMQNAADKVDDPIFRKDLQDKAMADYVVAAKMVGIYDRAESVFETLRDASPDQLANLGFDPITTVDSVYLRDSLKQFGTIYDSVQKAPPARLRKGDTEADDVRRRDLLYKASTGAYSSTKIIGEFQSKMLDRDFPSAFSPEAEGNTSEVQQYNSLVHQLNSLNQFAEMSEEHGDFFKGYIEAERSRIRQEQARLQVAIDQMIDAQELADPLGLLEPTLGQDEFGFYYDLEKYKGYTKREREIAFAMEADAQKKHAEYTGLRNKQQYMVSKFSNPETGIQNSKSYLAYQESIHRRDQEVDDEQSTPPPGAPPTGNEPAPPGPDTAPPTGVAPTPQPTLSKNETIAKSDVIINLKGMLTRALVALENGGNPEIATITAYIQENLQDNADIIRNEIMNVLRTPGNILLSRVQDGSYTPDLAEGNDFATATMLVFEIMKSEVFDELNNEALPYIEQVNAAIREFVPPQPLSLVDNLTDEQKREATEFVNELVDNGLLPGGYTMIAKADPVKFLEFVSQQAQNYGEGWIKHTLTEAPENVVEAFGQSVIDYAIELFPAPVEEQPADTTSAVTVSTTIPFPNKLAGNNFQSAENIEKMNSILPKVFTLIAPDGSEVPMTLVGATSISGNWRITYRYPNGSEENIPLDHDDQVAGRNESQIVLELAKGFTRLTPNLTDQVFSNMVDAKVDETEIIDTIEQVQQGLQNDLGVTSPIIKHIYLSNLHYVQTEDGKYYIIPDSGSGIYESAKEVTREQIIRPFRSPAEWEAAGVQVTPPAATEAEPLPNLMEMTRVGRTNVLYDRVNHKFVYRTPTGRESSYNQGRKVANQITPRFFRTWFRELSTPEQRDAVESMNGDLFEALRDAQNGKIQDSLELVLMRSIRNVKFSPSIMNDLTDVSRATWSSENGQPLDTFVSDYLMGPGNILEQNGFGEQDEQDLMNEIISIIGQYPKGIRAKDIKDKEGENNPVSKLEALENDFFQLTGLDLIKSLEIYNDERQSFDNGKTEVPEPVDTHAEVATADTEGSGLGESTPPPTNEPPLPKLAENSDEASASSENYIDRLVDKAKLEGMFIFPQNMPEEVVMDGNNPRVVDGAVQLKTTQGNQQRQLLRQHNILKQMGDRTKPVNFWSEDANGNPTFKIKLEMAGDKNQAKYTPWVYNTAEGLINLATRKPYRYPFIVAMVVDQNGDYVYFNDNGDVSDKAGGMPFGFIYTVEDYKPLNLKLSRRGLQLRTGELLNGKPNYLSVDPLQDISNALMAGATITGSIIEVASGKLSSYNVDNSGATWAKEPQQRTVAQMIEAGDLPDTAPFIMSAGEFTWNTSSVVRSETGAQNIKLGQPYILDEKTGLKIPLRGKKIKDLTINGESLITPEIRAALEELSTKGYTYITEGNPTAEQVELLENLYNFIRALVYSQSTPVFLNKDKTMISMLDQRPTNIPLLETEVNYSTNISSLRNPFDKESEGFSYRQFVRENFLSGAIPAELVKGEKSFEKLNRRIIFILDKDHQGIIDSGGARTNVANTQRVSNENYAQFVNKTYKKRGGGEGTSITITGLSDGNFTITGPSGTITQPAGEFMRQLITLEEVKLPAPTDEVREDFQNNIKLSEAKQKELNEKARTMSKGDLDNLDFGCD